MQEHAPQPGSEPRARRASWKRFARIALVVVAPFLLLELALRVVGPHVPGVQTLLYYPKRIHRYDRARNLEELLEMSVLGYQPGSPCVDFVLNSRSLRTHEYAVEAPPGTFRVLTIGDSFTFSAGVPFAKAWPTQLEARLGRRLPEGVRVEVLNLGVPAVGTEFQHRLWELEGSRLGADLVVLAFPVGSNFSSSAQGRRRRDLSDHLAWWSLGFRVGRNAIRLTRAAPVAEDVEGRWVRREPLPAGVLGVPLEEVQPGFRFRYDADRPVLSKDKFGQLQQAYLGVCTGADMDELFRYSAECLLRFRDDVVATGTEFLVMICPAELQASPSLLAEVAAAAPSSRSSCTLEDVDAPQEFLRAFFDEHGIRYVDLLPAFREVGDRQRLYGQRDSHWNIMGNTLAANELFRFLTRVPATGAPWPWEPLLAVAAEGAGDAPAGDGRER